MSDDADLIPAATVLLVRDHDDGPEVLMVRRNSKIAFGGMWAFPGGRVDDHERVDGDELGSARVAAVREVTEETGLVVGGADLRPWSFWIPPPGGPASTVRGPKRRFATWFFAVASPDGDVQVDGGEIHEHAWRRPAAALDLHRAGEIELVPPTWITLFQLAKHGSVADLLAAAPTEPPRFATRPLAPEPLTLAWEGDAGYHTADASAAGARHRLVMHPENRWVYEVD